MLTDVPMEKVDGLAISKENEHSEVPNEAHKTEPPRCTKCRRMTSGHEGPYGSKCTLKALSAEELAEDDAAKLKAKEIKKHPKRKSIADQDDENVKKKEERRTG